MPQNTPHDFTCESRDPQPATPARNAPPVVRPPQPVPLAVWFVPADPTQPTYPAALPIESVEPWPLPPSLAEKIISDYASPGSTVLPVGGSAAVIGHAAARLDCRTPAHPARPHQSSSGLRASVDLLILTAAGEPRDNAASAGRGLRGSEGGRSQGSAEGSAAGGTGSTSRGHDDWPRWATWLTPRGILAVVLPPGRPPQQPAAVIAAAVGVGLAYLQHIPAVLWTPGEDALIPPGPDRGVHSQLWHPDQDVPLDELHPAHADVILFTAPDTDPTNPRSDRPAASPPDLNAEDHQTNEGS